MSTAYRVCCLQTRPVFGEVDGNLAKIDERVPGLRADLVVLPELFATGYAFREPDEMRALAEPFPGGPTVERVARWSLETGASIVAGFAEREGDRCYNAAVLAAGGVPRLVYRKAHLFGFEAEVFTPGDHPPPVYEHEGVRVGVMICFDWIFPEWARLLALAGADVIAHPSNLILPWCQRSMPTRALENRLFTVTANRVGAEDRPPRSRLAFTGHSIVCGPDGETLAEASSDDEETLEVSIDVRRAREKRLASGNNPLTERRPRLYTSLANGDEGAT